MDKNYIIQKPPSLSRFFSVFHELSPSFQAEILSVLIGIIRKSERNLLAAIDAKIYSKILELLNDTDDEMVVDLLIDILSALTSLTIDVNELKLFLRYLQTENDVWVRISYWDIS